MQGSVQSGCPPTSMSDYKISTQYCPCPTDVWYLGLMSDGNHSGRKPMQNASQHPNKNEELKSFRPKFEGIFPLWAKGKMSQSVLELVDLSVSWGWPVSAAVITLPLSPEQPRPTDGMIWASDSYTQSPCRLCFMWPDATWLDVRLKYSVFRKWSGATQCSHF